MIHRRAMDLWKPKTQSVKVKDLQSSGSMAHLRRLRICHNKEQKVKGLVAVMGEPRLGCESQFLFYPLQNSYQF